MYNDVINAYVQMQLQYLERQQQHTEQTQQPPVTQQHQLPGPGLSMFAPEVDHTTEAETSKKSKKGPVWKRKHLVIEQINELIDELDEIDGIIALQVDPIAASYYCADLQSKRCDRYHSYPPTCLVAVLVVDMIIQSL